VSSLGMTEPDYTRITYDLTMHVARTLVRLNPHMSFCYISGAGTDSSERGRSMWARVKGKTENDLMKLPFAKVFAFRPGYIKPTPGLRNAFLFSKLLAPLYPVLKTLFPHYVCTLRDIGLAMIFAVKGNSSRTVIENRDIAELARAGILREMTSS
jgi:hypothetical protein